MSTGPGNIAEIRSTAIMLRETIRERMGELRENDAEERRFWEGAERDMETDLINKEGPPKNEEERQALDEAIMHNVSQLRRPDEIGPGILSADGDTLRTMCRLATEIEWSCDRWGSLGDTKVGMMHDLLVRVDNGTIDEICDCLSDLYEMAEQIVGNKQRIYNC